MPFHKSDNPCIKKRLNKAQTMKKDHVHIPHQKKKRKKKKSKHSKGITSPDCPKGNTLTELGGEEEEL